MQLFLLLLILVSAPTSPVMRVQLTREGTRVVDAVCRLVKAGELQPFTVEIELSGRGEVDSLIVLPNQRLQEMEAHEANQSGSTFRVSGEVFAYKDRNFLLIREVVALVDHSERSHPTVVPVDPNKENNTTDNSGDSIEDIVKKLEEATGPLAQSIRDAAENPRTETAISVSPQTAIKEGTRITARRCHLTRNEFGAWVAIFVADASGLSDPPCTILPGAEFATLTKRAGGNNIAIPVLLTGEIMLYHGHSFLVLHSWRTTHKTDHLDG